MRYYSALVASLVLSSARAAEQGVLSKYEAQSRDSFAIFNEVNGLLRQWGNALRPNGFSITLASIPLHTLLYHARTDPGEPSSPEWFAFDPEMSYGIYGGRQNTSVFLRTYQTTSSLDRLLYLNGLSAALTFSGTLDSQDLLTSTLDSDPFGDYARAERLCAWANHPTRNISGFVRTNAGFEVLLCDVTRWGLELVRNVNVTRWADEMDDYSDRGGSDWDGQRGKKPWPPHPPPSPSDPRTPPPDHPRPPGRPRGFHFFAQYASWEWLRAASHTYDGAGEARVRLDSGWHVTAYGIPGSEPASRMASLSNETIDAWRLQVDQMVSSSMRGASSGVDWRGVTDRVVARYADRLVQLKELLRLADQDGAYILSTNTSVHLKHAHRLVSSLLLPFFDRNASRDEQIELCTRSILLPNLDVVNQFEKKVWDAIMHVHISICTVLVDVYSELTSLGPKVDLTTLEELVARLDWSVWVRCPEVCPWGEICYIPIWPLLEFGTQNRTSWSRPGEGSERPEPQCAGTLLEP
ncbi:hypothetical protein RSOL_411850 [Rhizoctonia solani AG-3 Rhs1AP]|uniref:Transmembrane protein n=1 Tax=Rhizoctonia solani AG-3 Rhs1AP TaxID=1086054 RepID=X8JE87_9AGAM|nr:hypothetical protein RSOL_411850 [Rhizoctonia solani AG-3 Rhs1AP]